jgi:hypothetical protein
MVEPGLDERFTSAEVALRKLHRSPSEKLSVEVPVTGVVGTITKPSSRKVELVKSADALTIYFPQAEVKPRRIRLWFSKGILLWLSASLTLSLVSLTGAILLILFWLCGSLWERIALNLSKRRFAILNQLKIDQHQMTFHLYEKDQIRISRSSPRNTITSLEYQCREDGYCSLTIWADRSYTLGSNQPFSTAELRWLADELSQWLELPLKQTRQYSLLPTDLLQDGAPQLLEIQAPIVKPHDSQVVLLKKPGWIEILTPANTDHATHSRLYIDHQQIDQTLPSGEDLIPSMRQAITALEYRGNEANSDCFLRIWASQRKYELGKHGSLSPEELKWLAYELSEWLGLPIYSVG